MKENATFGTKIIGCGINRPCAMIYASPDKPTIEPGNICGLRALTCHGTLEEFNALDTVLDN